MARIHATTHQADVAAEQFFAIYYALGANRSLATLRQVAPQYGFKRPALSTLAKYSTRRNWQQRVRELDEQAARQATTDAVASVRKMNEDQAAVGGIGVQFAAFALERMLRQLRMAKECEACGLAPLEVDAGEVARVMDVFAKWQRLGMGEVTDRREIAVTMWNILIQEVMQLFLAVNIYEDPDQRKREFALGFDDTVQRHLGAVALE